jgi:hypothetical protein
LLTICAASSAATHVLALAASTPGGAIAASSASPHVRRKIIGASFRNVQTFYPQAAMRARMNETTAPLRSLNSVRPRRRNPGLPSPASSRKSSDLVAADPERNRSRGNRFSRASGSRQDQRPIPAISPASSGESGESDMDNSVAAGDARCVLSVACSTVASESDSVQLANWSQR